MSKYRGLHLFSSCLWFSWGICDDDVSLPSWWSPSFFLTDTENHWPDLAWSLCCDIIGCEQLLIQLNFSYQFMIMNVSIGPFSLDLFHHFGNSSEILLRMGLNLLLLSRYDHFSNLFPVSTIHDDAWIWWGLPFRKRQCSSWSHIPILKDLVSAFVFEEGDVAIV